MIVPIAKSDLRLITGDDQPRILDVRLAEALEFERPRKIRDLIERNIVELESYAPLPRHGAMVERPQGGGRQAEEYWLTKAQARTICMLSNAPRAPQVRAEINAVFDAWESGELLPATEVPTVTGMRDLFAGITPKIDRIDGNVIHINSKVDVLAKRLDDLVPRRDFPTDTKKQYLMTVRKMGGLCPCGCCQKILDDAGERLPNANYEHWYAPNKNGVFDGWLVNGECNEKMKNSEYREKKESRFKVFHEERLILFPNNRAKEPVKKRGSKTISSPAQYSMKFD